MFPYCTSSRRSAGHGSRGEHSGWRVWWTGWRPCCRSRSSGFARAELRRASSAIRSSITFASPSRQLFGVGYGEERPIASNKRERGRAQNRRVDIIVVAEPRALDTIRFPSVALFPRRSAEITEQGRAILEQNRESSRELLSRASYIEVVGHTDDVGDDAYNQDLSEQRAKAVRDYLVSAGVDGSKILEGDLITLLSEAEDPNGDALELTWFVDGEQYASADITDDVFAEFHHEFYILLNLAVAGAAVMLSFKLDDELEFSRLPATVLHRLTVSGEALRVVAVEGSGARIYVVRDLGATPALKAAGRSNARASKSIRAHYDPVFEHDLGPDLDRAYLVGVNAAAARGVSLFPVAGPVSLKRWGLPWAVTTLHDRYPDPESKVELASFSIQGGGTVATALAKAPLR